MPFKSEAQRRFLWMRHPDIAKRWSAEYGSGSNLPMHVNKAVRDHLKNQPARKAS